MPHLVSTSYAKFYENIVIYDGAVPRHTNCSRLACLKIKRYDISFHSSGAMCADLFVVNNMPTGQPLSEFKLGQLQLLREQGASQQRIAQFLGCSQSVVSNFLNRKT